MWDYAELSQMAKALGGPEVLVNTLTKKGIEIGIKQTKGKFRLMLELGFLGGSVITSLVFWAVNHYKKGKEPAVKDSSAAEQLLIHGIKAYDEEAKKNPEMETLPEITREEAEAQIDQYVQKVADELKLGKDEAFRPDMPRKLIQVVEHGDMVDEVYQEEDGTLFHDIYYKDAKPNPDNTDE